MYLATKPPLRSITIRAAAMIAPMTSRMSSGSSRADIAVEPTRSQNITVSWRRSAASGFGAGSGAGRPRPARPRRAP